MNSIQKLQKFFIHQSIFFLLSTAIISPLFAAHFEVNEGSYADETISETVNTGLESIADELNEEGLVKLLGNQDKLARGMGNANACSYLSGFMYAPTEYQYGMFSVGLISASVINPFDYSDVEDDLKDGEDSYIGGYYSGLMIGEDSNYDEDTGEAQVDLQLAGLSFLVGVNGDRIRQLPVKNLLLLGKLGFASYQIDDLEYSNFHIGAGARYKFGPLPISFPIYKVYQLSAGAGLYYSYLGISYTPDTLEESSTDSGLTTETETDVQLQVSSHTLTIPVNVIAHSKLLWFTSFYMGTGMDLALGLTSINASADSQIRVYSGEEELEASSSPGLTLKDSETLAVPNLLHYRMIAGFGFNVGPFCLETPFCYYPLTKDFTLSLSVGAAY